MDGGKLDRVGDMPDGLCKDCVFDRLYAALLSSGAILSCRLVVFQIRTYAIFPFPDTRILYLGAILVVNAIGLIYRYKKWRKFRSGLPLSEKELPELHVYAKEDLVLYMQAYEYVEGFLRLPSRFCWEGLVDLFGPQHFEYDYDSPYWKSMEELYQKLPGYTVSEDSAFGTDTLKEAVPTCANAMLLQDVKEYFEKIVVDKEKLEELANIKPVPVP